LTACTRFVLRHPNCRLEIQKRPNCNPHKISQSRWRTLPRHTRQTLITIVAAWPIRVRSPPIPLLPTVTIATSFFSDDDPRLSAPSLTGQLISPPPLADLMLHLNDLLHRHHVVIEMGHDP
jgi:hypothetical protein